MKYFIITLQKSTGEKYKVKGQGRDKWNAMCMAELKEVVNGVDIEPKKTKCKEISIAEYIKQ